MTNESGSSPARGEDDPTNAFRELREYARGVLDVDHQDVSPIAGLVDDDEIREVLVWMAQNYDPTREDLENGLPRDFWETSFAQNAIQKHATNRADKAIREGNITQAGYLTGLPSYKADVSGLHAINQLADWLVHSEQCKLIYLAALMGRGKTDFSATMFEVIHDHFRRVERSLKQQGLDDAASEVPTPEFAANFHLEAPSDAEVEVREIHREAELLEWGAQGSSADERWFIFDEASTELTAQSGANAQKVAEKMAPFVKKMRKMGINMIVIGHDKGDVHVAIRSLADFVDKRGTKTASFYAGISNREPTGHLFDLDGIPPTSWTYDTDDTADWSWTSDEEAAEEELVDPLTTEEFREWRDERIAKLRSITDESGDPIITQPKLAKAMGLSQSTVSQAERRVRAENGTKEASA